MASVVRQIIRCSRAPTPVGPYNQAVVVDKTVYVSGAIGMDPKNNQLVTGGVENETDMALKNIGEVLKDAGSCFDNVVKTTVLLADINDYATVNKVYCKYFPSKYPARAAYQVAALPKGAKVEIEAIAIVGNVKDED